MKPTLIIFILLFIIIFYILHKKKIKPICHVSIINSLKNNVLLFPHHNAIVCSRNNKSITYSEYYNSVLNIAESINFYDCTNICIIASKNINTIVISVASLLFNHTSFLHSNNFSAFSNHVHDILFVENKNILRQLKKLYNDAFKSIKIIILLDNLESKNKKAVKYIDFIKNRKKINITNKFSISFNENSISNDHLMKIINACKNKIKYNEIFVSYLPLDKNTYLIDVLLPIHCAGCVYINDITLSDKVSAIPILKKTKPTIFYGSEVIWINLTNQFNKNLTTRKLNNNVMIYILRSIILKFIGLKQCKIFFADDITNINTAYLKKFGISLNELKYIN